MPNPRLSAIILIRNAGDSMRGCLESVKWADEIIIVDGLSTDRTVDICRDSTGD
jgi:glycosyltransferase involved in cell wall biosynthesis